MDADPEERGRRRFLELKSKNPSIQLERIIEQIKQRDNEDIQREISPLVKAKDAISIDTTHMPIEELVDFMVRNIKGSPKVQEKLL